MRMPMPVGIQDFKSLREGGYLYIDKTERIYSLLPKGYKETAKFPPYFLSRPRRFGKSLLLSTIRYLFEGEKDLFKGLWIYDKWDWSELYPVILVSMPNARNIEELERRLSKVLIDSAREVSVDIDTDEIDCVNIIRDVVISSNEKYGRKVVILIDEYDRPILDNIEKKEVAKDMRDYLRGFYGSLKDLDEYIKFLLITGVTRFSRAGIFSGLNNLKDISLDPRFGNIVGITQEELEEYLVPYINECGGNMEEIKEWYNGYNFLAGSLYNPFDVLKYVDNGCDIQNYWFETGTPTFLIKVIEMGGFYLPQLDNVIVGKEMMDRFDVENIRPEVLLFQAGYLTIKEVIKSPRGTTMYRLKVPNKEVEISLGDTFLEHLAISDKRIREELEDRLYVSLLEGRIEEIKQLIKRLFESIPYNYHTRSPIGRYEGYYASVLFAFFFGTGLKIQGEDTSRIGRSDITVFAKDKIYIIEIKTDADEPAIKQIKERKYYEKYLGMGRKIYLIGINISSKDRKVKEISVVEFKEK